LPLLNGLEHIAMLRGRHPRSRVVAAASRRPTSRAGVAAQRSERRQGVEDPRDTFRIEDEHRNEIASAACA
jgi:hypothetical protein